MAWWAAFNLNEYVFASTAHSLRANWIFLPAALRLIAILLFGEWAALGLMAGAWLTVRDTSGDTLHELVVASTSGFGPLLAVALLNRRFQIPTSLVGLRPRHIALFSLACAVSNAVLLNGYLWLSGQLAGNFGQIATVFIGDVLGTAIMLSVLSLALSLILPRHQR